MTTATEYLILLPTSVPVTKAGRQVPINLNWYRNAHYQTLNKAKVAFKNAIMEQLATLPFFDRIAITYTVYPRTKQLSDIGNVCSIADKFFCDALVEASRIQDDNYTVVLGTQHLFGAIDRENPRIEARIHPQI